MRRGTDTQTDTQTAVINIHFASAAPHAKCIQLAFHRVINCHVVIVTAFSALTLLVG